MVARASQLGANSMPVGSIASAVPPQIAAALAALANTQSAELQVAAQLTQGLQAASISLNPDLGQIVDLSA
jgi:hypothetical protein